MTPVCHPITCAIYFTAKFVRSRTHQPYRKTRQRIYKKKCQLPRYRSNSRITLCSSIVVGPSSSTSRSKTCCIIPSSSNTCKGRHKSMFCIEHTVASPLDRSKSFTSSSSPAPPPSSAASISTPSPPSLLLDHTINI